MRDMIDVAAVIRANPSLIAGAFGLVAMGGVWAMLLWSVA